MKKTRLEILQNAVKIAENRLEKTQQELLKNEKSLLAAQQKLSEEEAKLAEKELKAAENADKPKRKSARPVGQIALGTLANRLVDNLQNPNQTLVVPEVNLRTLKQNADALLDLSNKSDLLLNQKRTNTDNLKRINDEINLAVSKLKSDLLSLHGKTNIDAIYSNYGLGIIQANYYSLVQDNTLRADKLAVLINKLQENGNPIQQWPNYNLNIWVDLQRQHAALWEESEKLRANRSAVVNQLTPIYEEVENAVKKIHQYVNYAFPKSQVKGKLREIGFLRESF
ncbi:MAG: hypothetical protein ACOVQA_07950 [Thermoflexibacteraceae bacterium]